MAWTDQNPEATDVLVSARIASTNAKKDVWFEIDKLPDSIFRLTIGNLFGSREVTRGADLERVLRAVEDLR